MYNCMLGTAIACVAFVASATAEDTKTTAKSIDGVWTVVCYEKDGQPQADAKGMTVKASNGTLVCSGKDGKPAMTMKVEFGPDATVMVTETEGDSEKPSAAKKGVYVLTQDYLAICIHDGKSEKPDAPKSKCTVLLKRGDK